MIEPSFTWCPKAGKLFQFLSPIGKRRWASAPALALCIVFCQMPSLAMAQHAASDTGNGAITTEERVKAASLYKFLNYVDWPSESFAKADTPYVIGVASAGDIADELIKISVGRNVNNRAVNVKKMLAGDSVSGIHVLYVGKGDRARLSSLLRQAQRQPILVVTETEGTMAQGSMINFTLVEERVRFEVALDPVEKAGLKLSSRILSVAISVTKGTQP